MNTKANINMCNKKNNLRLKKGLSFLIFPLLSTFIMYYYNLNGSNMFMIIGLVLMLIPILIYDSEYVFYILLFTLSNERMFRAISGGQSFIALLIIFLAVKVFIENDTKINLNFLLCTLLILILMVIKNIVLSTPGIDMDLIRFICNSYIFIGIITIYKDNMENFAFNSMIFYSLGALLTSCISLYYKISIGNSLAIIAFNRFAGLRNDANYYAVSIALAISLLIILYFKSDKKGIRNLSLITILLLFGGLSLSRGFIIANIPNVILLSVLSRKSKSKKRIQLIIVIIIITLIILMNVNIVLNVISEQLFNRFKVDSFDGGRLAIWSTYLESLTDSGKNLFFGLGKFDKELFSLKYGLDNVAHNILIGSIVTYGLLITLLILNILLILLFYFRKTLQIKRWKIYYNMPLLTIIFGFLFLDAITSNIFFYGYCLSMLGSYVLYLKDYKDEID